MEPFTITCATCASRIRVRNSDLLGQLANCPKCNSMILIANPAVGTSAAQSGAAVDRPSGTVERAGPGEQRIEVQRPHGPTVDSTALTREGLPPELIDFAAASAGPRGDDDQEYRLAPIQGGAEHSSIAPQGSSLAVPPVQSMSAGNGREAEMWETDSPAHLPSADWTSESTNKTRQLLLVGFLGFAGVLLSGLLFYGFLRWHGSESGATAHDTPGDAAEVVALKSPDVKSLDNPPDDLSTPASDTVAEVINEVASESANDPVTRDNASLPPMDTSPPASSSDVIANVSDGDRRDAAGELAASSGDASQQPRELPKQLQAFGPMLQYEIQPQFSDATEILSEAPVTAEDLGLATTDESIEVPAINVEAQAKSTFPALVMKEMPLSQFVSLWSNVSGVPTVVNLDSLLAAGIDRNQNIGLALVKSASIGSLIDRLGAPLGLEAVVHDNSFVELTASRELIEQQLPEAIALDGLVPAASADWLIESLALLFPEYPRTWKMEAGKLLRPQNDAGELLDALAWSAVVRLVEGWRQAAGMPTTLPNYNPSFFAGALVGPSDVEGLEHVLQQVQPEARPLAQTIPHICREAGVHVWIDWPAVASIGLGPQSTGLVLTNARPLRRALSNYVLDFPFVLAVLDKQTLWLTSNQTYRASPRQYVLPNNGLSVDEWKSRLRPLTPAAAGGVGVGAVVVIATPDEKFVLVRCCPMLVDLQ